MKVVAGIWVSLIVLILVVSGSSDDDEPTRTRVAEQTASTPAPAEKAPPPEPEPEPGHTVDDLVEGFLTVFQSAVLTWNTCMGTVEGSY